MTSAARSIRLRDRPCATPASVFIEHGTIDHAAAAVAAARDRRAKVPIAVQGDGAGRDGAAVLAGEKRHELLDRRRLAQLVAQQSAAVVGDDELDVDASARRAATVRVA